MTKISIKLAAGIFLAIGVLSGCITTGPQKYVNEQDQNNILILYTDGSVISSDHGANFAGKYRQDDTKITVTWDFMGLVEFYAVKDKNTLVGPEPKKYKWILSNTTGDTK